MVVASTLAFLAVNGKVGTDLICISEHYLPVLQLADDASKKLTKGELVMMAMENEKRVGKQCILFALHSIN